jgi:hypothetical protein
MIEMVAMVVVVVVGGQAFSLPLKAALLSC